MSFLEGEPGDPNIQIRLQKYINPAALNTLKWGGASLL